MLLLNVKLDEEMYIKQPEVFVVHRQEDKVCKLVQYLYRLKQQPKQWLQKFDQIVLPNGSNINETNQCMVSFRMVKALVFVFVSMTCQFFVLIYDKLRKLNDFCLSILL